jgi:hypothetical protein
MSFYAKVLLGAGLLLAIALAGVYLLRDSEEEVIEKMLQGGAAAASRGDAESIVALVSKSYRTERENYEEATARIRREIKRFGGGQLELLGAAVTIEGETAEASFRVRARAGPYGIGEFGMRLQLRKEPVDPAQGGPGVWKVTAAEDLR